MVEILIVEGEQGIRTLLVATLGACEGVTITQACRGGEALEAIYQRAPRVVLVDARLPDMPGLEVCETITRYPACRATRIVVLSGWTSEAHRESALAAGADYFFSMPFSPSALLEAVYGLLEQRPAGGLP